MASLVATAVIRLDAQVRGNASDCPPQAKQNDGERRACCVKVDAPNIHEASALFREKWPVIESMARDGIKGEIDEDGVITLVMP